MQQDTGTGGAATQPRPDWEVVALLWGAMFLNQADRQVYNIVLPLLKVDLTLSDQQLGLIATLFTLVYGLLVPFAGLAGDLFDRRRIVTASLLIFSAGTLLTGFASGFIALLVFRSLATGAGEALYAPAAASIIGESHVRTRGRAMAIHQTANYTGVVLGSFLTGWVAEAYGWRSAFFVYGVVGLAWATLFWARTRRHVRPVAKPGAARDTLRLTKDTFGVVVREPLLLAQFLAFGGLVFSLIGFLTWMPTLLYERFDLSLSQAGLYAVLYHYLLAYAAVLATSWMNDRLIGRYPKIRLITMSVGLILCAPALVLTIGTDSLWVVLISFGLYGLFRGMYDASIFAGVMDMVEDRLRSSVTGLLLSVGFLVGAPAPLLMGMLKEAHGLDFGVGLMAAVAAVCGAVLLVATLAHRAAPRPDASRQASHA